MIFTTRPIDVWPRPEPRTRGYSPFSATYSNTRRLLERELGQLNATNVVLQIDVREQDLRLDGELRANARPQGPRVALAFDSKHGPLRYYCDRWNNWQANLRGIALGLEAQRKLERYGITSRGEQYTGWKALGAGIPMGAAMSRVEAVEVLRALIEERDDFVRYDDDDLDENGTPGAFLEDAYRLAAKYWHPDVEGGDRDKFELATRARDVLAG